MHLLDLFLLPAIAYQVVAIAACWRHRAKRQLPEEFSPPVSVLKPVRGLDPDMPRVLRTQVLQDYPNFEVLFGVADPDDPAIPLIRDLQREFPGAPVSLHIGSAPAANAKVGTLIELSRHAKHPVWVVNDSDIHVTPEYLREVVGPLKDPGVGLVTCLYRSAFHSSATAWESFGIAVEFMPSALVAPLVGVREFGLGSTLCFRAEDLQRAGGFAAIRDYIADDYQLARRIVSAGKHALFSRYVVETSLGESDWAGVWGHQLRWARTIRASKGLGFAGLPISYAGLWIALALAFSCWRVAFALLLLRWLMAYVAGWRLLRIRRPLWWVLLAPLWDLWAMAIWSACYLSREVLWRGRRLSIGPDGKIEPAS